MTISSSHLKHVLQFLNQHLKEWMAYMGIRAAFTLVFMLVLTLVMLLGRTVSPAAIPLVGVLWPLAMLGLRLLLRKREWRWMSLFLLGEAKPTPPRRIARCSWLAAALESLAADLPNAGAAIPRQGILRRWRLQQLGIYSLILFPFLAIAVAMAWKMPWPLVLYALLSAGMVSWGFATGGVTPVLILLLVARSFPGQGEGSALE